MTHVAHHLATRLSLAVVAGLLVGLLAANSALASKLHLLTPSVTSFASDGGSYIAWEVPGKKPIFVLDTRTGRRSQIIASCPLRNKAPASAGRFLLECGEEENALLDVHTGITTMLPYLPPDPYGGYGPLWEGVGTHYVIGRGGSPARCHKRTQGEGCLALYEIATGAVKDVAESLVPNPDHAGAPPVCAGLRRRVLRLSRAEVLDGLGPLSPLESNFSGADGLVAEMEGLMKQNTENARNLVIVRCHGAPTLLPVRQERDSIESGVWSVVLSSGVLTWDTGYSSASYDEEASEEPGPASLRHGALFSYDVRTRRRQRWPLPILPITVDEENSGHSPPFTRTVGAFGYSAHTRQSVFWVRQRSFKIVCGEKTCGRGTGEDGISAIYTARL